MITIVTIVQLAVDTILLYYVAKFMKINGNSLVKAALISVVGFATGYVLGPLVMVSALLSIGAVFVALLVALIVRLFLIKFFYRIGFGQAFSLWVLTVVVSIVLTLLLPTIY